MSTAAAAVREAQSLARDVSILADALDPADQGELLTMLRNARLFLLPELAENHDDAALPPPPVGHPGFG